MKRENGVILIIVAIILGFIWYSYSQSRKVKSRYNWVKTYSDGTKEPYDFGTFREILKSGTKTFVPETESVIRSLNKATNDSSTYVFIGRYCYLTRAEIDSILNFAHRGNSVVFIAEGLPDTLMNALTYFAKPVSIKRFDDSKVRIESFNEYSKYSGYEFNYRFYFNKMNENTDWYYLDESEQLSYYYGETPNRYIKLSKINKELNHAKFKTGKGYVYINTTPMLFTNYFLRTDTGFYYADEAFNGIPRKHVIYDIVSREYKDEAESLQKNTDSPLTYILKQPALKWAWYVFLVSVLLFFIFKARRAQRIIPVLEQKRNTSLSFIETLSGLFFNNANHKQMAQTKMQLFLFFIRTKLGIATHDINEATIRHISTRSKVPLRTVERVFEYYSQVIETDKETIFAENLMEFNNRITEFYKTYHSNK